MEEAYPDTWVEACKPRDGASELVSVVIPCFMVSEYIGEAIESVLRQTHKNFEIIVVDDGCPDSKKLKSTLLPYKLRLRYIRQENRGVGSARNTAISYARGEWIAFLDGDDIWRPNYLAEQIAVARSSNADCVYPNALYFGASSLNGRDYMDVFPSSGPVTVESLALGVCHVFVGALVRAEALRNVGGFDERLRSCEDLDLWLRILLNGGRIVYHRNILVDYRQRAGSLTTSELGMLESRLKIFDWLAKSGKLTTAQTEAIRIAATNALSDHALLMGKNALVDHQFPVARRYLEQSGRHLDRIKLRLILLILRGPSVISHACVSIASWMGIIGKFDRGDRRDRMG
jgi:GT2 family glycosyltransferase